ncbi:MAG: ribosome biogenesis GTP-binding protein YsxC, partial [Chitinivibrionales bacterium]|nr:ribosome biogenesis GTP-binding protein YsxC [Chitinivibrionales bacterium]MBD3356655.1 ribosome biogenesis GTP-binding protein YsxC [Chitinivibrionales bacterium]
MGERIIVLVDVSSLHAAFICSAARYEDAPPPRGGEFCLLGRSNVGKSSFVNHVLGNRRLARVSGRPGKTNLANFYRITEDMIWVDLPGYGYARTSHGERKRWSRLINDYCRQRPNLAGILWLLDFRHPGTRLDVEACRWLKSLQLPLLPIFTKCDKVPRSKRQKHLNEFERIFGFEGPFVLYS